MTFLLRVPSDGTGYLASSIAGSFLNDSYIDESHLHQSPREFEIYPNTGTLGPQSEIEIQVRTYILAEKYVYVRVTWLHFLIFEFVCMYFV